MNKIAFFALLAAFVAGGAFAADAKPVVKTSTGTIVSYTPADAATGAAATLVVKVGTKDETFVIDAKTVVEGKDKKAIAITTLKVGAKVQIKFTEDAKKVLTAVSVILK
jgi:ABC-type proline/glycine betaine transport system substrate-binding protein